MQTKTKRLTCTAQEKSMFEKSRKIQNLGQTVSFRREDRLDRFRGVWGSLWRCWMKDATNECAATELAENRRRTPPEPSEKDDKPHGNTDLRHWLLKDSVSWNSKAQFFFYFCSIIIFVLNRIWMFCALHNLWCNKAFFLFTVWEPMILHSNPASLWFC